MKHIIQEKENNEDFDIISKFSEIVNISKDESEKILDSMEFEDYYDIIGYIEEKNISKIKEIYNDYKSKKMSIPEEIIEILDSNDDTKSKQKRIKSLMASIEKSKFDSYIKEIQKDNKTNIDLIYNLFFKELPENMNLEEKMKEIYDEIKNKKSKTESTNLLKKLESSSDYLNEDLINKGYNYYVHVEYPTCKDKIIDWLESNSIEFLVNQQGLFHIKCINRDLLYKIENVISNLLSKYREGIDFIRDNKTINDSKIAEMKNKKIEEQPKNIIEFATGETVLYKNKKVTIKIPNGPSNTVGIIEEGKLNMVDSSEVQKLTEGVLGFSKMPSLNRMMELAGIENQDSVNEEDDEDLEKGKISKSSIEPDIEKTPEITKKEISDVNSNLNIDHPIKNKKEFSLDVPPADVTPVDQSEEFIQAIAMLDQVHQLVTEMKLSEYKIFVQRLEDFTQRIQRIGREYLR